MNATPQQRYVIPTGVDRVFNKTVGALTRAFCAKLESEEAKREPQGLSRFIRGRKAPARKPLDAPGFGEGA